jgi:hypothetical protein
LSGCPCVILGGVFSGIEQIQKSYLVATVPSGHGEAVVNKAQRACDRLAHADLSTQY